MTYGMTNMYTVHHQCFKRLPTPLRGQDFNNMQT